MQVSRSYLYSGTVHKKKQSLQLLIRVALALTILCCTISIFCICKYTSDEHDQRIKNLTDLKIAYTYFDKNRILQGIDKIVIRHKTKDKCQSGEIEEPLYRWPGSKTGYKSGNLYYAGKSSTNAAILAKGSIQANFWKAAQFCITRINKERMKIKAGQTASCSNKNQVACSVCSCYENPTAWLGTDTAKIKKEKCPISHFTFATVAVASAKIGFANCDRSGAANTAKVPYGGPNNKDGGPSVQEKNMAACVWGDKTQQSYLVDLQVEMSGAPCLDYNKHPKAKGYFPGSIFTLLNQDYSGCGTVTGATDTTMSYKAAETTVKAFFTDNKNLLSQVNLGVDFYNVYTSMVNEKMYLYGRNKIILDCDNSCDLYRNFKFQESSAGLINSITNLWGRVKRLAYVGGILSAISLALLLYIISLRNEATQSNYFWSFSFVLAVTGVILVYIFLIYFGVKAEFTSSRNALQGLERCILDKNWKKVPGGLYTQSSMDTFHKWMLAWLVLCSFGFFVGAAVFLFVISKLGEIKRVDQSF